MTHSQGISLSSSRQAGGSVYDGHIMYPSAAAAASSAFVGRMAPRALSGRRCMLWHVGRMEVV